VFGRGAEDIGEDAEESVLEAFQVELFLLVEEGRASACAAATALL
jgi:hypothetical protein